MNQRRKGRAREGSRAWSTSGVQGWSIAWRYVGVQFPQQLCPPAPGFTIHYEQPQAASDAQTSTTQEKARSVGLHSTQNVIMPFLVRSLQGQVWWVMASLYAALFEHWWKNMAQTFSSSFSFLENITFMSKCDRYHLACDSVWFKLHEAHTLEIERVCYSHINDGQTTCRFLLSHVKPVGMLCVLANFYPCYYCFFQCPLSISRKETL